MAAETAIIEPVDIDDYHALLSPSSAHRWMVCPGSVHAQAAMTTVDSGNKASREGTVAHSLLEVCLQFGFDPQDLLEHELLPDMPPIAQHMVDGVRHALDWVEEYIDTYGAKNLELISEQRVRIGSMIGVPDEVCNGTPDIQIRHLDAKCLVTVDYKHGMIPVDVEDNPQLMLYTLGGIKEHGKYKEYKNVIIQPRAAKRRVVDEVSYKNGKLVGFTDQARRAAIAAMAPDAPRVAGEHCRFCRAANNCQTYRRRARQVAADEFDELPDPDEIPDDDLSKIADELYLLRAWLVAMEGRLMAHLVAGGKLENFELGWGSRKRLFQDPGEVVDWCIRHKLPQDVFMPRSLLSPMQLENALKKLGLFPRKKRNEPKPDSPIAHLIGYTVPKQKLKPKKGNDATGDFDAMEDDE